MPYTLKLIYEDGSEIESPYIAPNNPSHSFNHPSITRVIANMGANIVKRCKDVKSWRCEIYEQ